MKVETLVSPVKIMKSEPIEINQHSESSEPCEN